MNGEVQIGTWVNTLRTPQIAQMLATAGFDFMYIDMEHSSFSIETVGDLCYAALAAGLVPIVRPAAKDPHLLSRPLDNGAMGLLIPHVDTREEAEAVVKAIRFPPLGERGMNLQGVHTGFGRANGEEYVKSTHAETLLLVQIESDRGIGNLDKILSVDGVDGAVIGRADLSTDLGLPGQTNHPEVVRRVETMIARLPTARKDPRPPGARRRVGQGVDRQGDPARAVRQRGQPPGQCRRTRRRRDPELCQGRPMKGLAYVYGKTNRLFEL